MTNLNQFHALLIGIDYYLPNKSYSCLQGCVRDVNHVANFLKQRLNIPENQISLLTASQVSDQPQPTEPQQKWPTYENIIGAFKQLIKQAQSGDQVYIHYSGHGGRAATNYSEIKTELGLKFDEVLVPTDISNSKSRYIRDIEFAHLLQQMVDKGLVVTVVLDCCHSGGATRGGESGIRGPKKDFIDTTPRPKESLVASVEELAKTWRDLSKRTTRGASSANSFLPGSKDYILLAACRPHEKAYECMFNGEGFNGALTYWLLDSLRINTNLTYQALYNRINAKVHSQFPSQTPMLFGDGKRLVFSSGYGSLKYAVNVMQIDETRNPPRIQLNAGLAHGLSEGTQFVIYPPGTTDFSQEEKQLALVEITEISAGNAWAEIIKTLHRGKIEPASQAVIQSVSATLVRRIRLFHATQENTRSEDLPPRQINQSAALQAVEQALVGNGWLKLAADNETAHYQVSINRFGEYEICDSSGKPFPNIRPMLKIGDRNAATKVVQRLVHLTKYKVTEEIDNLNTSLTNELVVELMGKQANYQPGTRPSPQAFDDKFPTVKDGEWVVLRISNESQKDLNIALLNLQSDWAIDQLDLMNEGAIFEHFYPGQEELIPIQMSLPDGDKEGEDIFKVFATVDELDLRWLKLPRLDQPTPKNATRGLKIPTNPLEELLASVGADINPPTTRKGTTSITPSSNWLTKQVTVKVKKN
ncbi:MAG: caspase family protein [Hapalosiphonaceae cyanobacterium JJU2]|nr:MAG: caspase family protein [Hapalosiphonaceae cyanobacterium JJU2]